MFSLIRVWINGWVNSGKAGDLRRYRAHYDVIVMVHSQRTEALEHHDMFVVAFRFCTIS